MRLFRRILQSIQAIRSQELKTLMKFKSLKSWHKISDVFYRILEQTLAMSSLTRLLMQRRRPNL
jgi:hypothetical protein